MGFTEGAPAATPSTLTNGAPAGRGLVNYRFLPGTWRGTANDGQPQALADVRGRRKTDLQAHATCLGAAWDTPANILAWQDDPFYNYIPWQKTSAGIGDEPAKWIAVVKAATGVDLAALNTPAEFKAACETCPGGDYYPADTAPTSRARGPRRARQDSAPGPDLDAAEPDHQLQTGISSLTAAKAAVDAQLAAALAAEARAACPHARRSAPRSSTRASPWSPASPAPPSRSRALLVPARREEAEDRPHDLEPSGEDRRAGRRARRPRPDEKARKAIDKHLPALKVTVDAVSGAESSRPRRHPHPLGHRTRAALPTSAARGLGSRAWRSRPAYIGSDRPRRAGSSAATPSAT